MKTILIKAFSYKGRINRLEYLAYGLIAPLLVLVAGALLNNLRGVGEALSIALFLVAISMSISSIIKRARDTNQNTSVIVILFFLLPIIALPIALFAPSRTDEKRDGSIGTMIVVGFIVVIFGILAAVTLPKLAQKQEAPIHAEAAKSITHY